MEQEQIAVSGSALWVLKQLSSEPLEELGEILADRVVSWRYKNQLRILEMANTYAVSKSIKTTPVSLKTLLTLLDAASLEEESSLQELWARLLINAGAIETSQYTRDVAIAFLKSVTINEALVLNEAIGVRLDDYRKTLDQRAISRKSNGDRPEFNPYVSIPGKVLKEKVKLDASVFERSIGTLIRFRIFKQDISFDASGRPWPEDIFSFTNFGWEIARLLSDSIVSSGL